jgi:collagen triple helix repeat protein
MLSPLRNRFGIPGVISVVALVFAMLGGAYAASNNGDGEATASAKAKKGPRGPKGATGPAGPAGPAGPQGPAGANGKDGANGANGSNGATGANGKSIVTGEEPALLGNCEAGGFWAEVQGSGTKEYACNGETGDPGPQGEPWTPDNQLPAGATLTGSWSLGRLASAEYPGGFEGIYVPISFALPLAAELEGGEWKPSESKEDFGEVHFINDAGEEVFFDEDTGAIVEEESQFCAGSAAEPLADPGHLCVYAGKLLSLAGGSNAIGKLTSSTLPFGKITGELGASKSGAVINFPGAYMSGSHAHGWGSWAVTG